MKNEEKENWKFVVFYYNQDNPKVFVPKRLGIGWTLNFAKWQSWFIIGLFLALVAVILFFRK